MDELEVKSTICKGLSHPTRWKIYSILEREGRMNIVSLLNVLREEYDFRQDYVRVKYHLVNMEECGIVKLYTYKERAKNDEVELIKKVRLSYEELPLEKIKAKASQ